jgi:osmotically-inducible protein OsmY
MSQFDEPSQVLHDHRSCGDATDIARRIRRLLRDGKGGAPCNLQVERKGNWFTLEGRVETQRMKSAIFEMVPEIDGARWIVDKIHVGPDPTRTHFQPGDEVENDSSCRTSTGRC